MLVCQKCGEKYVSAYKVGIPRGLNQGGSGLVEIKVMKDCRNCRPPRAE